MANQEHLDVLRQGVNVWNEWRIQHPGIDPNLREANLFRADLGNVHLFRADLSFADLKMANFENADLREAHLDAAHLDKAHLRGTHLRGAYLVNTYLLGTDLSFADLRGADLTLANLFNANLRGADLREASIRFADLRAADLRAADLRAADLVYVNLTRANLRGADLNEVATGETNFNGLDLSEVKGLETIEHKLPSYLDIDTIYRSKGNIPEVFLKGVGVDDTFIAYVRSLVGKAIEYYSCFISYSSKDGDFAKRLYADLQSNNVRCWFAPEDLKWGDKIRSSIDESIRLHDKLLLVLSQHSVASQWVEQEVERALAREHKENKVILFPIRLDTAVMDIEEGWPALIRNTRNIGDFSLWKRHDAYQKALDRLLRDLKAEGVRRQAL